MKNYQALVIGGGFIGCMIAVRLSQLGLTRVLVAERLPKIMQRATRFNQARIHRGYHYPRDTLTALRSAKNYHRYISDFRSSSRHDLTTHYAIAHNSRVTATQFENFCRSVDIPLWPASPDIQRLMEPDLIDSVYRVEETVFDCDALALDVQRRMMDVGVEMALNSDVSALRPEGRGCIASLNGTEDVYADYVFNVTYAELDQQGIAVRAEIKRERVEVTLIVPPPDLAETGITVMDGPFFSVMPFPSKNCHTLTHVRYTPLTSWMSADAAPKLPDIGFGDSLQGDIMQRDAARYIPCLKQSRVIGAYREVKAVLAATENNDARPILLEKSAAFDNVYSILGAKIDNVYDILDELPALLNKQYSPRGKGLGND
jgi:glycine/D-amino acid oxidase-like deaminating enzyme